MRSRATVQSPAAYDRQNLGPEQVGKRLWPKSADETAASVDPSSFVSKSWVDAAARYGLIGDGATDNTAAFAKMCSVAGQALFIRRGTYVTGSFLLPSGTTLYLEPGVVIEDSGALGDGVQLMRLDEVTDVHIIGWGAIVTMDRADYTSGEQRHGVVIRNCENVCIEGLASNNSGGDGFYIGRYGAGHAVNVRLIGCSADNNRRQGLSISDGRHVRIVDCRFTNTSGTAPAAGIDIEPNAASNVLHDIKIVNPYTEGNAGDGIDVYLGPLTGASDPVSIDIFNHHDRGSLRGAVVGGVREGTAGYIRWHSPVWQGSQYQGFYYGDSAAGGVRSEVMNPVVIDCNQVGSASVFMGAAYSVRGAVDRLTDAPLGGVHFISPAVKVTGAQLPVVAFHVEDAKTGVTEDIRILDPVDVVFGQQGTWIKNGSSVFIRDTMGVFAKPLSATTVFNQQEYLSRVDNSLASDQIYCRLPNRPEGLTEFTFEVVEAHMLVLQVDYVDAALRLYPGGHTNLKCNQPGAHITVRRRGGGYQVVNKQGDWT